MFTIMSLTQPIPWRLGCSYKGGMMDNMVILVNCQTWRSMR